MREIFFKASRKKSSTYGAYRKIEKRGNLEIDTANMSDDVIFICIPLNPEIQSISIDCDKKTGEFRLFTN